MKKIQNIKKLIMKDKKVGVLFFDNTNWHGVIYSNHTYEHKDDCGFSEDIPRSLAEWLKDNGVEHVRLLISAEIQRIDTKLPAKISYADGSAMLSNELSILTGIDAATFHCSAVRSSTLGANDDYLLVSGFEHEYISNFREKLRAWGFIFDGVCSLELAFLAYCTNKYNINYESFIVFSNSFAFALPGNQHLQKIGTISLQGGTNNAKNDYDNWVDRLQKRIHHIDDCNNIVFLSFDDEDSIVEKALKEIFPNDALTNINYNDIRDKLAHLTIHSKINSFDESVSVVNTHIPRKKFSHFFIIIPSMLILLIPLIYWGLSSIYLHFQVKSIDASIKQYLPIESKYNDAKKRRKTTTAKIKRIFETKRFLIERRKPLYAFIHVTYFFSKYASNTVTLYSIKDIGNNNIQIIGIYQDPEDGLAMNSKLDEFIKDKKLMITKNRVSETMDQNNIPVLTLEMMINYKDMVK